MQDTRNIGLSTVARTALSAGLLAMTACATYLPKPSPGPSLTQKPSAVVPDISDAATLKPGEFYWHPERSPSGPVGSSW